jgi:3-phosphoshikimate 1-carboxyvinyltransferase
MSHAPDGALVVAVVAMFANSPTRIGGLSSLRHKESDRIEAIVAEMRRIGGVVEASDDVLTIEPSRLRGGVIDAHGDHRIAMAMTCAGIAVDGVAVDSPQVVNKTWPGFWDFIDLVTT